MFIRYKNVFPKRYLEISIYKRYFDKTKCMYFVIKDENFFDKYIKICEKKQQYNKKRLIVNLYIIKNIERLKKIHHQRKPSMFLYANDIDRFI